MDTGLPSPPTIQLIQKSEELNQHEQFLMLLIRVVNEAAGMVEFQEVLQFIAASLRQLLQADGCYITAWDPVRHVIAPLAASGPFQESYASLPPLEDNDTFTTAVLAAEHVITVSNAPQSPYAQARVVAQLQAVGLLGVPLIAGGEKLGAAMLTFRTSHTFSAQEVQRAEQVATPIALALAKARLLHQEREQRTLAEALVETGAVLNETLDFDQVLDRILEQIARVVPYDSANIMLVQNGRAHIARHRGYEYTQPLLVPQISELSFELETTANLQQVVTTGKPIIISDTLKFTGWVEPPGLIRAWAGVPIIIKNRVAALINVDKTEPGFFQLEHITGLSAFASQVALALQNAQLHKATQRQLEELSALQALAAATATTVAEGDLLEKATQIIGETWFPHNFGVLLLDETGLTLHPHVSYRLKGRPREQDSFPIGQGIVGYVAQTGRPYRAPDVNQDSHYFKVDADTQAELCVPLFEGNRLIGVINAESAERNAFSDDDENFLMTFAHQLGSALEKLHLITETRRQAEELRLISRMLRLLNATPDVTIVFPEVSINIKKLTGCTAITLILIDEQLQIRQILSPDIPALHRNTTLAFPDCAAADNVHAGVIHRIPDLSQVSGYAVEQHLYEAGHLACLVIPLHTGVRSTGCLYLAWPQTDGYQAIPLSRFQQIAHAIALALQRSYLFEEIKQWAQQLTILHNISREIAGLVEAGKICETFITYLAQNLNLQSASIFRADHENQELVCEAIVGPFKEHIKAGEYRQKFGVGLVGRVAQTGRQLIANDAPSHPNFAPWSPISSRSEAVFPLRHGRELIGILNVDSFIPQAFHDNDVAILTIAADQLSAALERSRLFEQTRQYTVRLEQRNRELTALNEIGQILVATFDRQTIYRAIYRQIAQPVMGVPHLVISLFDARAQTIYCDFAIMDGVETNNADFPVMPLGKGVVSETIRTRQPRIVDLDNMGDGLYMEIGEGPRPRSALYVPLISGENVLGVMFMQHYAAGAFSHSDLTLLSTLASQVSVALEKVRLLEETQLRTTKLEALSALSSELRLAPTIEAMLSTILQRAMSVVGGSLGSLYLNEAETGDMVARAVYPPLPNLLGRHFQVGEGIIGHIAATGEIHITENMHHSTLARFYEKERQMVEQKQIRSGIGLPLHVQERIVGVMYISLAQEHTFTDDEIEFLVAISEIAGSALDRMMLLQTLEERVAGRTYELAAANERLQELDRLKSRFISEVSHELRTPITNLGLYLDLFTHSKPEKHTHYLAVLRKQTDRLARLIEDILSLSRVELGREKIQFAPVNLNEIVKAVISVYQPQIAAAGLTLRHKLAPELPQIAGERNHLSQLVSHLLVNAIQYTQAGTVHISTGYQAPVGQVFLQMSDTGSGISDEDREHLFDRFYRGRYATQSNIPGTGLGLAIVKEVVDLHGGSVEVESVAGEGTTFTVWLPVPGKQ